MMHRIVEMAGVVQHVIGNGITKISARLASGRRPGVECFLLLLRCRHFQPSSWLNRGDGNCSGMLCILEPKSQKSVLSVWHEGQHDEVTLRRNGKIESEAKVVASVSCVRKVTVFRQQFLGQGLRSGRHWRSVRID